MGETTKIQWTDETWNPLAGCTEVSPGCANCYAAPFAARLAAMGQAKYVGTARKAPSGKTVWTGKVNLDPDALAQPLRWRKPRRVFVNSMSDLFHEAVPDEFIDRVFAVMAIARPHTFQVLTKRAGRMSAYASTPGLHNRLELAADALFPGKGHPSFGGKHMLPGWPLRNVWLGVSVEDQARADERTPHLLRVPAAVRFLSVEPLLGPVDLTPWLDAHDDRCDPGRACSGCNPRRGELSWVIVGGESGPGARPCDVAWIRALVGQCKAAGVACFVKQMGAWPVDRLDLSDPTRTNFDLDLADPKGGDSEEWPADLRVREFPNAC